MAGEAPKPISLEDHSCFTIVFGICLGHGIIHGVAISFFSSRSQCLGGVEIKCGAFRRIRCYPYRSRETDCFENTYAPAREPTHTTPVVPRFIPWQVSILQDDGLLAEYVHILADSSLVKPGDRVVTGQPICVSGGAGFCPTPHLHFQLQEGEGDNVPTVLFALLDGDGHSYFPVAGRWYGPQGQVEAPLIRQPGEARRIMKGVVVEGREGERVDGRKPGVVDGCGEGSEGAASRLTPSQPHSSR